MVVLLDVNFLFRKRGIIIFALSIGEQCFARVKRIQIREGTVTRGRFTGAQNYFLKQMSCDSDSQA